MTDHECEWKIFSPVEGLEPIEIVCVATPDCKKTLTGKEAEAILNEHAGLLDYNKVLVDHNVELRRANNALENEHAKLKRVRDAAKKAIDCCPFCQRGLECKNVHRILRDALADTQEKE